MRASFWLVSNMPACAGVKKAGMFSTLTETGMVPGKLNIKVGRLDRQELCG